VAHNLPAVALYPVTIPTGSTCPSDFRVIRHLKNHLTGKRFATDTEVKRSVTSWYKIIDTYISKSGYKSSCREGQMLRGQW